MAERTAFVTGGTGFLGLNLIEQLTAQRWQVTALHRPSSDISMWSGRNARQTRINVEGTRQVVEAAMEGGARRLVHTSTWNTYGLEQREISEELPQLGGESWINYDRTKFLAEEEVRKGIARRLDAVIINPSHIMGRYDRKGWAQLIMMGQERWMPGVPPGAGTFCHAEAVASAHIAAAERGQRGANYLMSGADASFVELFTVINEVTGSRVPLRPPPAGLFCVPARLPPVLASIHGAGAPVTPEGVEVAIAQARVTSRRAEQELGYRPAPLRTMVEDCYRWLLAEGLLKAR